MKNLKRALILCGIISIGLGCVQKSTINPNITKEEMVKQIYSLDKEDRKREKEITDLRNKAYDAERNKHFEQAHDLKEKAEKSERELKDYKVKLEESLKGYEKVWDDQPWWQQIALECGGCYTHFAGPLELDDAWGVSLKLHWIKRDFRRFHLGSYLYYPLEVSENYPLHQVEASPLILEYRHIESTLKSSKNTEVKINSYRAGFGVLTQAWNNTWLKLNLSGGFEGYYEIGNVRTGPVICYALGLTQKLSDYLNIGVEVSESVFWSRKNEDKSKPLFNPSGAVFLRITF